MIAGAAGAGAASLLAQALKAGGNDRDAKTTQPAGTKAPAGRKGFEHVRIDPESVVGTDGFYRAGKDTQGRWWLLRPDGRPFIYKGVCAVCDGMPAHGGKPANDYWKTWHKTYTGTVGGPFCKTIDAFDPGWARAYDAACARVCGRHKDNTNLLGYYSDNEPFWGQPRPQDKERKHQPFRWGVDEPGGPTLLQIFLALPPERGGHEAAWAFALKRHGGAIAQLAKDWRAEFATREQLRQQTEAKTLTLKSAAYGSDHDDFTRLYADTYFRVTGEAIRRHDPNHLVLGVRHASHWTAYGRAALESYGRNRKHVDVVSINTYRYRMSEPIAEYAKFMDFPIIIGETGWGAWLAYDWKAPEGRYSDPVGWVKKEGVHQICRLIAHPQVTGYTWFKWYEGKDPDEPQVGVVTNDLVVNRVNASMFRRMHPVLEDVHAGFRAPDTV